MNLFGMINSDPEIVALKKEIKERTGFVSGIYFWDGETIDEYRERLRKTLEELSNKNNHNR